MSEQLTSTKTSIETTDDGNRQKSKIYAKDSMDRYGDDLFKLLLSYLLFKYRFRYECLSKQFRRTVFGSVVDITLSDRFIQRLLTNEKTIDTQLLATIAIKCGNIQTIDCRGISNRYEKHISEVLFTFRDNCQHLREIYCNLLPNFYVQFLSTLGPLVTRLALTGINSYTDYSAITHCHRLSELKICEINQVFNTTYTTLFATNLRTFSLHQTLNYSPYGWSVFVAHNQCLQSLAVSICVFPSADYMTEMCGQLSRLSQLRELTLGLALGLPNDPNSLVVDQCLRTIGVNCKQLKRLSVDLFYFPIENGVDPSLPISLDSLRFYSRLRQLDIHIIVAIDDQLLDPLRHCKGLTHLELDLPRMTANVLKDMHIKCPRLQYLCIQNMNNIIDTECLSHLSRLPALQMLVIHCPLSVDHLDNYFSHLLTKSPKLKTIKVLANDAKKFYSK